MEIFNEENIYKGIAATAIIAAGIVVCVYTGYKNREDEINEEKRKKRESSLESKARDEDSFH